MTLLPDASCLPSISPKVPHPRRRGSAEVREEKGRRGRKVPHKEEGHPQKMARETLTFCGSVFPCAG